MALEDNVNLKLNQNLWGLIVAYSALGAAEYWDLKCLFWFAVIASAGMSISVAFTLTAYTVDYWRHRLKK